MHEDGDLTWVTYVKPRRADDLKVNTRSSLVARGQVERPSASNSSGALSWTRRDTHPKEEKDFGSKDEEIEEDGLHIDYGPVRRKKTDSYSGR